MSSLLPKHELHLSLQEGCYQQLRNPQQQLHWAVPKKCDQLRALHNTNAESAGRTEHSIQGDRQVRLVVDQMEVEGVHHGCSRLGELHRIAAVHHTVEERRKVMADQEEHRMETAGQGVLHKEAVVQGVHRTAKVVPEVRHKAIAALEARRTARAGQEVHHKEMVPADMLAGEREVLTVAHCLRSMSPIHLLCQSGFADCPSASQTP